MVPSFVSRSDAKGDIGKVLTRLRQGHPVEASAPGSVDAAVVYAWRLQAAVAEAKLDCVEELAAYIDERLGAR